MDVSRCQPCLYLLAGIWGIISTLSNIFCVSVTSIVGIKVSGAIIDSDEVVGVPAKIRWVITVAWVFRIIIVEIMIKITTVNMITHFREILLVIMIIRILD